MTEHSHDPPGEVHVHADRDDRSLCVCIVYDCLFPFTVGGAERWYRNLAVELADAGHRVTYLTRRQWPAGEEPDLDGVEVVVVSRPDDLYDDAGRRRIGPPLRFGAGVLAHLAANRHRYDVVHTCAFPYFSLLAARVALAGSRVQVGVDWFEVWSDAYWREYLGALGGRVGAAVQAMCVRLTPLGFVASQRSADRLSGRIRGDIVRIGGLYAGDDRGRPPSPARGDEPLVLFVGRLIPEKRADLVPAVVAHLRRAHPRARGLIIGDGPSRARVEQAIAEAAMTGIVEAVGFVPADELHRAMGAAACLLFPTMREGYGLVVIEAASMGTPTVVIDGPDNAAVELIEVGVNGRVSPTADIAGVAAEVAAVIDAGGELRRSARAWFDRHAPGLRTEASSRAVVTAYEGRIGTRAGAKGARGRRTAVRNANTRRTPRR